MSLNNTYFDIASLNKALAQVNTVTDQAKTLDN